MRTQLSFYIDGSWITPEGRDRIDVINPATETAFAQVSAGTAQDVDRAIQAARRAFPLFAATPVEQRMQLLKDILRCYRARVDEMARLITAEMGSPISFSKAAQAPAAIPHLENYIRILSSYDFETLRGTTMVRREPIGVAGLITPWNWPIVQLVCKVLPALAAGCTMVLKPSEKSPLSAMLFADILHEAGVPKGVFNLVNGTGETVGREICIHRDVDMVSFTGSTRAGIEVARDAAFTVKRVCQELGGKAPNVLLPDADFESAVTKGALACFRNAGQSCSAPTRMLVPANRLEETLAHACAAAEKLVVGDPLDPATEMGPVANAAQFEKVQQMIQKGIDEGAKLITGGPGRPASCNRGYFVRPTVFAATTDMTIAREEIFGPVLSVLTYESEKEAIAIANDTVYGLTAYVQSENRDHARDVARQLRAGSVLINYAPVDFNGPFGGFKQSGNGREYGIFGLEEFLETKGMVGFGS